MQQQPIHAAWSTEEIFHDLGATTDEGKMTMHDLVVTVEQVAVTLGLCGMVHFIV